MQRDQIALGMVVYQMPEGFVHFEVNEKEAESLREILGEGCRPADRYRGLGLW